MTKETDSVAVDNDQPAKGILEEAANRVAAKKLVTGSTISTEHLTHEEINKIFLMRPDTYLEHSQNLKKNHGINYDYVKSLRLNSKNKKLSELELDPPEKVKKSERYIDKIHSEKESANLVSSLSSTLVSCIKIISGVASVWKDDDIQTMFKKAYLKSKK